MIFSIFIFCPRICRIHHIFYKDSVALRRVGDENVGDGADELSVLNDGN